MGSTRKRLRAKRFWLTVGLVAIAPQALAADRYWIDPVGGPYALTSNWSTTSGGAGGASVPVAGDNAFFDVSGEYKVEFAAGDNRFVDNLEVSLGSVLFQAPGAATYNVDDTVRVYESALTLSQSASAGRVDLITPLVKVYGEGLMTFDAGSQSQVAILEVGDAADNSPGEAIVQGDSTVDFSGLVAVGTQTTGTSRFTVRGAGTTVNGPDFNAETAIGDSGVGIMEVLDGAWYLAPDGRFALSAYSSGGSRLTVDNGATMSNRDPIDDSVGSTFIGDGGFQDGTLEVLGGSLFEAGQFQATAFGTTVTVAGAGSELRARGLGLSDNVEMTVSGGATFYTDGGGGGAIVDNAKLTITGAGSRMTGFDGFSVDGASAGDPVEWNVLAGAVVEPDTSLPFSTSIEAFLQDHAILNVSGAGSRYDAGDGSLSISGAAGTTPQIKASAGGAVLARDVSATRGVIRLDGGSLTVDEDFRLAASFAAGGGVTDSGAATLDLLPGGLLDVAGRLGLGSDARVNLYGGEIRVRDLDRIVYNDPGVLDWNNGVVHVEDDTTLSPEAAALVTPDGTLGFGQTLEVIGTLTLQSALTVDGGKLSLFGLANSELLQLHSGVFEFNDDNLIIGPGGLLPDGFELRPGMTLTTGEDIVAEGLLIARGAVDGFFSASASGEERINEGDRFTILTRSATNLGLFELQGGRVDAEAGFTNSGGGDIVGRGVIDTGDSGFTNRGDLALSNGQTDVFGDVDNETTGRVLVSGNADVTFWDDVTHTGAAFNVSAGSSVTFFGDAGFSVTGGGDVYFEDDITPGASPGVETFGGNVYFGPLSTLEIEIGGTTYGEFDRLEIAGVAGLGGTLQVELVDLGGGVYAPQLGDSFGFLAADGGAGGLFDDLVLPDLDPGLEWELNPGGVTVFLNVVAALPGDYNFDGVVDAADYTVWRDALGQTGVGLPADGDESGEVDPGDYEVWRLNFGQTLAAASHNASTPEPTAALLLATGLILRLAPRPTRRSSRGR